ncbi:hypothetical protein OPT61_g2664 [Boeremia exigua]|uniref:Uncharacterized protein n=1 Tax=Boeremia exigua TaxID=749465 RepID=A0ACC2IKR1_9PLEO|nr:hypothetical protein OPT61_g2664 [Boeremia exigua]
MAKVGASTHGPSSWLYPMRINAANALEVCKLLQVGVCWFNATMGSPNKQTGCASAIDCMISQAYMVPPAGSQHLWLDERRQEPMHNIPWGGLEHTISSPQRHGSAAANNTEACHGVTNMMQDTNITQDQYRLQRPAADLLIPTSCGGGVTGGQLRIGSTCAAVESACGAPAAVQCCFDRSLLYTFVVDTTTEAEFQRLRALWGWNISGVEHGKALDLLKPSHRQEPPQCCALTGAYCPRQPSSP